jgi:hypothetical protein
MVVPPWVYRNQMMNLAEIGVLYAKPDNYWFNEFGRRLPEVDIGGASGAI